MHLSMPLQSTEYLYVPGVQAFFEGTVADPTVLPVHMAFMTDKTPPTAPDWEVAQWAPGITPPAVRILVGLDGLVLAVGWYWVWLRVTSAQEKPARRLSERLHISESGG